MAPNTQLIGNTHHTVNFSLLRHTFLFSREFSEPQILALCLFTFPFKWETNWLDKKNTVQKEFFGFNVLQAPVCELGKGLRNHVLQAHVQYKVCSQTGAARFEEFVEKKTLGIPRRLSTVRNVVLGCVLEQLDTFY